MTDTPLRRSRRELLKQAAALCGGLAAANGLHAAAGRGAGRFSIGACDWSIGMRARTGALELAQRLGLDGVQVSMGGLDNDVHLRRPEVQQAYRDAAAVHGIRIAGIALDVMNRVPYKSDPRARLWVANSVDVARALGVRVVLLAFFEQGDLRDDEAGQAEVIRRLKTVAPRAEDAGIILGIESWLSAAEHLRLIDAAGSPNVQVYYDVANAHQMGHDIYQEIRTLGPSRICEFHVKENGFLLGQGRIDLAALRQAIDDIDYTGWLQIEGAIPKGAPMFESYTGNVRVLRTHFGE